MATGFKVNSAKDDAAGLYVATGLNSQLRGLAQARNNANNRLAVLGIAEGALSNMTDLLNRIRDLGVQGANGVYDTASRFAMQAETDALVSELVRVKDSTTFNGLKLFGEGENTGITTFSTPPRKPVFLA